MFPELFKIPFTELTVKSYGLMMVVGFLFAVFLIRRFSRDITPDPQLITNAALYSLISGVVGARLFYVFHYFEQFRGDLLGVFAIWRGGLELLGGVLLAIAVIVLYMRYHRLPIRHYLDILAIGLMVALAFGRIGCFLNGCCYGKPTELPWGIRFPYGSFSYFSQVYPNPARGRDKPYFDLPQEFFGYYDKQGSYVQGLKPYNCLTGKLKDQVDKGPYRSLPVHPVQLYSSANAFACGVILYLLWRLSQKRTKGFVIKPGCTFAMMFIIYGVSRFFLEFIRDDNPYEYGWWVVYKGGTVSQNICIYTFLFGLFLMVVFSCMKVPAPSASGD